MAKKEKHLITESERLAQQVMDLFHVKAVFALRVGDYRLMSEKDKRFACDTLRDVTLCKIPDRNGDGMWFFLRKEGVQ